jgi:hypothetical protein
LDKEILRRYLPIYPQVYRIFDNELNDSLAIRKVKKSESDMEDINKEKVIN